MRRACRHAVALGAPRWPLCDHLARLRLLSSAAQPAPEVPPPTGSSRQRGAEPPPLWPPAGCIGGPVYPQHVSSGLSSSAYDPRWAGPGDGVSPALHLAGNSTTFGVRPGRDVAEREVGQAVAQRPVLQASSFAPEKLRELGIGGLDSALQALFRRAFASRALAPGVASQLGVGHVKGILLHGPPGTGKSLIARKLGTLLAGGRTPRVVNGPELLSRWVGSSEENVRTLFADAEQEYNKHGDAADLHVIIFDEIDALCRRRGSDTSSGGANSVGDSIVNQLLTKLDGVQSVPNVLVIGMTNRRDLLDDALLRPGRLEVQLEIGLPDAEGRAAILGIHTKAMRAASLLAPDVDLNALAAKARNFSGAELAGVVRAAASFAMDRLLRRTDRRPDGSNVADDTRTHGAHGRGLGLGEVTVTSADFEAALHEVRPALGTGGGALAQAHAPRGLIPWGPRFLAAREALQTLTAAVRHSVDGAEKGKSGQVTTVMLVGPPGTGKTALAATGADGCDFPFLRFVAPSAGGAAGDDAGGGGSALVSSLVTAFQDAHRSAAAVLVLDDVERLVGYSPVGPAYSNAALQALLVLLRSKPPAGRHLLVIATSSSAEAMDSLGISAACSATIAVHPLTSTADKAAVLAATGAFASDADVAAAAERLPPAVPVRHLLDVVDLAARHAAMGGAPAGAKLSLEQFLWTVHQFSAVSEQHGAAEQP
jgi:vesicle-fusing ATPase